MQRGAGERLGGDHEEGSIVGGDGLGSVAGGGTAEVLVVPDVAHLASGAREAGDVGEVNGQVLAGCVTVHEEDGGLGAIPCHGLVEVLECSSLHGSDGGVVGTLLESRVVNGAEGDSVNGLFEGGAGVAGVRLIHSNDLGIGDDGPDLVHDGSVVHVVGEGERGRDDRPSAEVGTGFGVGEARVVGTTRAVGATDFEHVGVCPAAGAGKVWVAYVSVVLRLPTTEE